MDTFQFFKTTAMARFAMVLLALCASASAQIYDPVQWKLELDRDEAAPGATVLASLTATIQEGWHIYSTTTPEGIALDLQIAESDSIASWEAYQPEPEVVYDPNFEADVEWYTSGVEFVFEVALAPAASGRQVIEAHVRYGACDDRQCLPPKRKSASATVNVVSGTITEAAQVPVGYQVAKRNARGRPAESSAVPQSSTGAAATEFGSGSQGLIGFSFLALAFGFASILTPCVFPMIPIYMGSFMSGGERPWSAVLRQAGTFCLGVIVLFTALGGVLAASLGPFGLSQIGSNAWVNLLIASVMGFFALSMLGAFELTLPSSWMTGASGRSTGTGVMATLMLSLVFTLASFACTGPFIGTLLAGSIGAGGVAFPVFGMALFATGLSAPFFVLALFPALLKRLPRSGGWLAVTKRAVGFVILAVGVKYLGNVDQVFGWGILTRERFLSIWIVLFVAGALYLWGLLRFQDEGGTGGVGLARIGAGAVFLVLAISLVPGMFGGRLGELDAHVPEGTASGLASGGTTDLAWLKDDYEGAIAAAKAEGKPLLVSFTGYACSNCKWMKANMFTKPEIRELLQDVVLVELYTDGFDEFSEQHQRLQVETYRSSSIPYYALLRPDGSIAATFSGQTRDVQEFHSFLQSVS